MSSMTSKTVRTVVRCKEQTEEGATIKRCLGNEEVAMLDPFLILDKFIVKPSAGFLDHPHRGFELVSYILSGTGQHEDFLGHKGKLQSGGIQWLTVGRGIVHCEWSSGKESTHGLQLWVNLSKDEKMKDPVYQEIEAKDVPIVTRDGVTIKVISGKVMDAKSAIHNRTPTLYLHVIMEESSKLEQPIPTGWSSFTHVLSGKVLIGPVGQEKLVESDCTAPFSAEGDFVNIENQGPGRSELVLIAGEPLNEPVVQQGPFVANTDEEMCQTVTDYKDFTNGFENARTWKSSFSQHFS